ncbi:MAG: hypothetical protein ACKVP3_14665 [Hyphomicrobiaceae bacterium]
MPSNFLDDHQLLAFFGVEPKVLDAGVPWFYNTLEFDVERIGYSVRCTLAPAYGDIDIHVRHSGAEVARLNMRSFKSLMVHVTAEAEILIASFEHRGETLGLMLKPRVWVGLGNFQHIPPPPGL